MGLVGLALSVWLGVGAAAIGEPPDDPPPGEADEGAGEGADASQVEAAPSHVDPNESCLAESVPGSAPPPMLGMALDHARADQPIQAVADRRGGHPQPQRHLGDAERTLAADQVQQRSVRGFAHRRSPE